MEIGREMNFSGEISLEKIYKAKKEEKLRGSFHKQRWDLESSIVQESPNQERKKKITALARYNHKNKEIH